MFGILHVSRWRRALDYFDLLVRLLPGGVFIAVLIAARLQILAARRATATTIAKNHYRKMLALFLEHSEIVYRGATGEALTSLQEDPPSYRKYRMLFTNMAFAMQELYFSIDLEKQPHWERIIANFIALFRGFINSEKAFAPPR
jgi:hypothetical protein